MELSFDPAIKLLGIIAERNEINIVKRDLHLLIYCSIIHNSQGMETI